MSKPEPPPSLIPAGKIRFHDGEMQVFLPPGLSLVDVLAERAPEAQPEPSPPADKGDIKPEEVPF